jgi:hypothetical protein
LEQWENSKKAHGCWNLSNFSATFILLKHKKDEENRQTQTKWGSNLSSTEKYRIES